MNICKQAPATGSHRGTAAARVVERVAAGIRHWHAGKASVWLRETTANTVRLEALWSELRRREGVGTAVLALINRVADDEQVCVQLRPHRLLYEIDVPNISGAEADRLHLLNQEAPDNERLRAWYEKHGYLATGEMDGDDPVMCRVPNPENAPLGISRGIAERLLLELKAGSDEGTDAFRYECFARRIVAAEYGRADAVEWATAWYSDLIASEEADAAKRHAGAREEMARSEKAKAEFRAGRCGNPNYQAFLDTVEDPSTLKNNAPYFAWISPLISAFEKQFPPSLFRFAEERQARWAEFLKAARDKDLSDRVRQQELARISAAPQ